jgi:peptidyl-tRNA hydrolase
MLGLFKKLHKARSPELRQWELGKCKKVMYSVENEDAMLLLQAAAKREGQCHTSSSPC